MNLAFLARSAALTGYFGLLCLLPLWYIWLAPSKNMPSYIPLGFLLTPLLFPFMGLLRGKKYTYMWTSYLSLLYFTHGVGEAYTLPDERLYGLIEILFSLMLFAGALFYVRLNKKPE